jgi:hypothetical protein
MDVETIIIIIFFTLVLPASWMFLVPIAKRMRREAERPSESHADVAAELDRVNARLAELEERVDFAERLLAQQRDPERLTGDRT